jgi:antitoxin HicB
MVYRAWMELPDGRELQLFRVLEPQEGGGFTVLVPALAEVVTEGDTEEEALAMAEDAIRLVLEDCAARGEPIPTASPLV